MFNHSSPVSRPISKVLVANRGEIALRVMRTCRAMGLATVAVFSDADGGMPFVRYADEAIRIGPAPARESYLDIEKILAAARATGADAIHPGYGFLSENSAFAHACAGAGITFIGPSAMVIGLLGSKREAKLRAQGAGVPIVPGYSGNDQEVAQLTAHGREVGFPLLVKASAGGGGKGMRIVRAADELAAAVEGAKREAASAFGDDTLLLEKYIERPRHIEIQILGDHHGTLVHLWERECSVQRRHQKVIEESPSPALDHAHRLAMGAAAVAVGKAVGYTNAGTVEFITDPEGAFYFLEVNTRLQVEHPVTELVTGLDLVREQIRVARGERLTADNVPAQRGHAIEVRLYAEDADHGYLPTTGTVLDFRFPDLPGLRLDAGVESGTEIGIHYDPMLAKVIAHAPTRHEAAALLARALEHATVAGVTTNREFLARVLRHPGFVAGDLDTHFLEHHAAELVGLPLDVPRARRAAIAAMLAAWDERRRAPRPLQHVRPGWRNVGAGEQHVTFTLGEHAIKLGYRHTGDGRFAIAVDGEPLIAATLVSAQDGAVVVEDEQGVRRTVRVVRDGLRHHVDGLVLVEEPRFPDSAAQHTPGALTAPMPGKVVKVLVAAGDAVVVGTPLMVLEAMKMEHSVKATVAGTVASIAVAAGDQVAADQVLAVVTPAEA
ncbi:MAG: ATP-grasp domain-containing protein [Deltaproteobacteria bacterium]|nr:ATP-grasp domain-containing protein [Deltaproteobacteria bacterium]